MGIIGDRPESGFRVELERPVDAAVATGPLRYAGAVVTPSERFALEVVVEPDGAVTVTMKDGAAADLVEPVRLLVRAAVKHARAEGADPPRRIVRWRADR